MHQLVHLHCMWTEEWVVMPRQCNKLVSQSGVCKPMLQRPACLSRARNGSPESVERPGFDLSGK